MTTLTELTFTVPKSWWVLAGCKPGGTVLDPFSGSGTSDYLDLSLRTRFAQPGLDLTGGVA